MTARARSRAHRFWRPAKAPLARRSGLPWTGQRSAHTAPCGGGGMLGSP